MVSKGIQSVIRRKNQWFMGRIIRGRFYKDTEINRLSDVENIDDYVILKRYLKLNGDNPLIMNMLNLDKLKADSVYILDTSKKDCENFEKRWWSGVNSKCKECSKECKQSSFVEVVYCPDFTKRS